MSTTNHKNGVPRTVTKPEAVTSPLLAPVIHPDSVFSLIQARLALDLPVNCLPREIRKGRLRAAKCAGRTMILGAWILQWVERGEMKRYQARAAE